MAQERVHSFDRLRVLATIGVVVLHGGAGVIGPRAGEQTAFFSDVDAANVYDSVGRLAVSCFFMISAPLLLAPERSFVLLNLADRALFGLGLLLRHHAPRVPAVVPAGVALVGFVWVVLAVWRQHAVRAVGYDDPNLLVLVLNVVRTEGPTGRLYQDPPVIGIPVAVVVTLVVSFAIAWLMDRVEPLRSIW
ncbi:hypothetical protein [Aeromicrobium sp. 50.2.37]|uniref:hypothetical protein n=1 Tax=Aeromicrobium sp. 50.2.37 TaxID=2969305 RepID=UPI00214FF8F6|nr:hypothetical protein [Aeromicrobium sp. 50.2.37]MCR4514851.1 hypothetical protein [Aeromicrobium sp. 50.2.37]